MRVKRKPLIYEAVQWFKMGDHQEVVEVCVTPDQIIHWILIFESYSENVKSYTAIKTLEGWHEVTPGDWIMTGVNGEHWPIKPDVFEKSYDLVDSQKERGK